MIYHLSSDLVIANYGKGRNGMGFTHLGNKYNRQVSKKSWRTNIARDHRRRSGKDKIADNHFKTRDCRICCFIYSLYLFSALFLFLYNAKTACNSHIYSSFFCVLLISLFFAYAMTYIVYAYSFIVLMLTLTQKINAGRIGGNKVQRTAKYK